MKYSPTGRQEPRREHLSSSGTQLFVYTLGLDIMVTLQKAKGGIQRKCFSEAWLLFILWPHKYLVAIMSNKTVAPSHSLHVNSSVIANNNKKSQQNVSFHLKFRGIITLSNKVMELVKGNSPIVCVSTSCLHHGPVCQVRTFQSSASLYSHHFHGRGLELDGLSKPHHSITPPLIQSFHVQNCVNMSDHTFKSRSFKKCNRKKGRNFAIRKLPPRNQLSLFSILDIFKIGMN